MSGHGRNTKDGTMFTSVPKWLFPIAATLVLAGGGIAAAEISTGSSAPVVTDSVPTTDATTSTTVAPDGSAPDDGTDDGAPDDGATTDDSARYWGPECGDGPVMNHGQYVSSQPKDGASRRAAAHSPCGKPLSAVGETTTTEPTTDPTTEPTDPTTDATNAPAAPTFAPTNGSSHSNGNGHGNRGHVTAHGASHGHGH